MKLWSRRFARLHRLLPIRGKALIFSLTIPHLIFSTPLEIPRQSHRNEGQTSVYSNSIRCCQGHRPDQILTNGIAFTIRKIAVIRMIVIILDSAF